MQSKYCIYPSLLDSSQSYIDAEIDYNTYWGSSDDPSISLEDYTAQCEKKLIDQINRCPKEPILAADRGTVFNEVVDMIIHRRATPDIEAVIESHRADENFSTSYIDCLYNGFRFIFDTKLCKEVASLYPDALSQYYVSALLPTKYGDVTLYGYIDEWQRNVIEDIKTTESYTFGKFEKKWQRHVYPYCVTETFVDANISEFNFRVIKFNKTTPLAGEIYKESYTYNHKQSICALTDVCEQFIEWLESRREFITDKKIFGGENADDYVGTPTDFTQLI